MVIIASCVRRSWPASAEELSALPACRAGGAAAGTYRLTAELTGQVERLTALNERLFGAGR